MPSLSQQDDEMRLTLDHPVHTLLDKYLNTQSPRIGPYGLKNPNLRKMIAVDHNIQNFLLMTYV